MKKMLTSLALTLAILVGLLAPAWAEGALTETNIYRALLLSFDYGEETTYVIGHMNPDADTVGSAMAYAYLLNQIGIKAEAAVSGPVNQETAYALNYFGIEPPQVIDNAEGKQFVLVDHSTYSQAIEGMRSARIVGIVDHHGIGDVTVSELINVRSAPAGATATLVFTAFQECGVEIPRQMAQVMLMALLSDTRNMTKNVTAMDREAYAALVSIVFVNPLYEGMEEAKNDYSAMTDWEIFQSDYKKYEIGGVALGIGNVSVFGEDAVKSMADRMYRVMTENREALGLDMVFTMIKNSGDDINENQMYMIAYGEGAEDVLQRAFGNFDGARYFIFKENLSRKKDVVPAITEALESTENGFQP
ncbi:MAG: DHH family phosphoesterase [Clostridia bacterium]|nr:DHH family phosphoesterase [Clostridia bacterium]